MDLTDLQIELRSIEEHISVLQSEIEKMKPKSEENTSAEYDAITKLARKHPISNSMLQAEPEEQRKTYIRCLSFLALANNIKTKEKLLYLSRIAAGAQLNLSAEEIHALGLSFDAEDLEKICFELEKFKYPLLADGMIISNLSTEAILQEYALIADIAKMMNCDQSDIRVIAQVARAVLTDDFDILKNLPVPLDNRWSGKFKSHIPNEWIVSQRVTCCNICVDQYEADSTSNDSNSYGVLFHAMQLALPDNERKETIKHPNMVKSIVQNGSVVERGNRIMLYDVQVKNSDRATAGIGLGASSFFASANSKTSEPQTMELSIDAPQDGIVFTLNDSVKNASTGKYDKYVVAFVSSIFDEYEDFCKWYKRIKSKGV